jgi:hypothetical protein
VQSVDYWLDINRQRRVGLDHCQAFLRIGLVSLRAVGSRTAMKTAWPPCCLTSLTARCASNPATSESTPPLMPSQRPAPCLEQAIGQETGTRRQLGCCVKIRAHAQVATNGGLGIKIVTHGLPGF